MRRAGRKQGADALLEAVVDRAELADALELALGLERVLYGLEGKRFVALKAARRAGMDGRTGIPSRRVP